MNRQLVEQGKIGLDDPVEDVLPEIKECKLLDGSAPKRKITLRLLVSRRPREPDQTIQTDVTAGTIWRNSAFAPSRFQLHLLQPGALRLEQEEQPR